MTTLKTKPLTLSVIPHSFGQGTDAGSIAGDRWTPGRDDQGVVNQASWSLVPTGRWVSVAGTRMDVLDGVIKAAMPQWRELSTWDRYTNSWSSMAPDLARSRIFFYGGGHGDGSNNGLYSFNFYKMGWSVEMLPSYQGLWSGSYRNSGNWGWCPESFAAAAAKIVAGTAQAKNDVWQDEVFWDGKQTAKHSYHSYVFVPGENSVMFLNGRLWKLNLDSASYTFKRLINDSFGNLNTSGTWRYPLLDAEHGLTIYDEVTNELLASAAGSSGITNRVRYNLSTDTWTLNPSQYNPPWGPWDDIPSTRVGRNVTVISPPRSTGGVAGNAWVYNLDSRSVSASSTGFLFAGGLAQAKFSAYGAASGYYDGSGVEFIAPLNRYWMWTLMADGSMASLEIDPTTTPWTISPKAFEGDVPTPNKNMLRKMFWMPDMNAVWLYDRASKDWYVYRF